MIKNGRVLILTAFMLIISCIGSTAVFAGAGSNASATVYVTISNDSDFVQGTDGTVMAHVPFTIEYFDLAEYGLERYYKLDDSNNVIEHPTLLHLLIRVLERYYAMRTLDREGDMYSSIVTITGDRNSLWLDRFWGHDGNLMYFVNHMYPIMYGTNGATADYILLEDGDEIDMAMYTDWSFYSSSAFLYFDHNTASAKAGRPFELQLLAKPTAVVNDGVDRDSIPMSNETIRVSSNRGMTWSQMTEKTDAYGMISLTFDSPGTYYVASGPNHTNYTDAAPAICVVTVRDITPGEQALNDAKQTAINDLQNYRSQDLYREAEQASLASIIQSGIASINAATTVNGVQTAYNDAISRIDALKTKAQYEAEEQALANAKETAIINLQNYKSPDLYREAEQASLASIIQNGTAAINSATTVEAVQTAYSEAISQIDALKTKVQYEAEEQGHGDPDDPEVKALAEAKTNAKAELAAYLGSKDMSQYRNEQKAELAQAVGQGNSAIDDAKNSDEVAAALAEAKAALDAVKTDEQMKAEEQEAARQLDEAKNNAKLELGLYMAPEEYRDADKALLLEILAEGETAIDSAKTKEEVTALLAEYKGKIDALKTDAQYKAEEKAVLLKARIKAAKVAKPNVTVKALKKHKAKVTWKKVTLSYTVDGQKYTESVNGYRVYRATKKKGKYKLVKTIKKAGICKYVNKKLKKDKQYFFKVRTYTKINGKTYLGKWSKACRVKAK